MKNNNDPIKQENRKALPKFFAILAASLVVGALLGLALVFLSLEDFGNTLSAAGLFFTVNVAPWLMLALPVLELAVCLPIYFSAKKRLAAWDGEDEAVSEKIESTFSVCLWIVGMAIVLDFFLGAAMFSGFVDRAGSPLETGPITFAGGLGAFLVAMAVGAALQQKVVDATKKLYPEKRGSVYDTAFQKKWFASCDEAERAIIGQCAMKAYQAMTMCCLVLWAVFALGGMFFNWGFLPAMAVCVIWGVGQSVYCRWSMTLSRPGAAL